MTEDKERDFTTGVQTVAMEPETAKIIWVRNCRGCQREFKTDDPKCWACNVCIKTYEFKMKSLSLAKRDGVKSE